MPANIKSPPLYRALIVCALGYFIDVFDIQLFSVLRASSLTDLGVSTDRLADVSGTILTVQMAGMILGAFLWGQLGDRLGRIKALYGSILTYSLGTLLCSLVKDPVTYGVMRFFTGFGLAGETGAAIILIAEYMSAQKRGWGVMLMAGIGYLGPAVAVSVSWLFPWRGVYVVAGLLGFALLILRMRLIEPGMYAKIERGKVLRGSPRLLMQRRQLRIFLFCILTGLPFVYTWNVLNFFSLELSNSVLAPGEIFNQKICLFLFYIGTSCGDLISGGVTQFLRSRRKTLLGVFLLGFSFAVFYLGIGPQIKFSARILYLIYFVIGMTGGGGWSLFSMVTAEHFGTNIRATVTIVIVNLVRGFVIPMTFAFNSLRTVLGTAHAALLIGIALYLVALFALSRLRETHGLDLDYIEHIG